MHVQNANLPNGIRLLLRGREIPKLFALCILISAASSQSFAGVLTLGGYTIFECGQSGSADFQACQDAMTAGEANFLAAYMPTGPVWSQSYLSELPILPLGDNYVVPRFSPDAHSAMIFFTEDPLCCIADSVLEYIWHNGTFSPYTGSPVNLCPSCSTQVAINDAGVWASVDRGNCTIISTFGCFQSSGSDDPLLQDIEFMAAFNDDSQLLVFSSSGQEYLLFDPPGAPSPVPEPATLSLLATVVGFSLASLHRHGRHT
jgi:hypothetical protein